MYVRLVSHTVYSALVIIIVIPVVVIMTPDIEDLGQPAPVPWGTVRDMNMGQRAPAPLPPKVHCVVPMK